MSASTVSGQVGVLAVVLGGYINGYSIVQELWEKGVKEIWVIDSRRSLATYSNKIKGFSVVCEEPESIRSELLRLANRYRYLVLFPTSDKQLEALHRVYDELSPFCHLPFRKENLLLTLDKGQQYKFCEQLGIPCPRSVVVTSVSDLINVRELRYPILLKPLRRKDQSTNVFRNRLIDSEMELEGLRDYLGSFIEGNVGFLVSEVIPGNDSLLYAYTAYRSPSGEILNEWSGRKLAQYPGGFGVFSSASNEAPEEVRVLGRRLVNGMDVVGIVEPEFKYDPRDGVFRLMEVNLRSMMWHRLGNLSGVNLQFTQWQVALGLPVDRQQQETQKRIHLIYLKHELANLILRPGYWRRFMNIFLEADERHYCIFDRRDIKPAIKDLSQYPKVMVSACLRRLKRA